MIERKIRNLKFEVRNIWRAPRAAISGLRPLPEIPASVASMPFDFRFSNFEFSSQPYAIAFAAA
jgi:hypothetical protein